MGIAKTLGQAAPAPATPTKLYTGATNGAVGKITVNNRPTNVANANIQVEIRIGGAATTGADFKWEQVVQPGIPIYLGPFGIGSTDEVWVTTDTASVNFNMDGIEL